MILHYENTLVESLFLADIPLDFLFRDGKLYYYRRDVFELLMGNAEAVVVDDSANMFFEIHFLVDCVLDGSVEAGFTHPDDARLGFKVERSEDLQTWVSDMVTTGTVEDQLDGTWLYKARSTVLVDSVTKTGQLTLEMPFPDPRSIPLTGVVLGNVDLSLPHFPYHLPADASTLQADLRSAGYTGATVSTLGAGAYWVTVTNYAARLMGSPVTLVIIDNAGQSLPNFPYDIPTDSALLISDLKDLGWTDVAIVFQGGYKIFVPNISSSAGYAVTNRVSWTPYLVENIYGDLVNHVGLQGFQGTFVNEDDIRTLVPKQFARVRMTWTP
jgi:hypothetical protein